MKFDLKRPCSQCPFRTDILPFLRPDRVKEICLELLINQGTFSCHKTNEMLDDEQGEGITVETQDSQHCAGAVIFLEQQSKPNQLMRVAERLGSYNAASMELDVDVYLNTEEMVKAARDAQRR